MLDSLSSICRGALTACAQLPVRITSRPTSARDRSFTVDERARVPFALIGVLLIVTSTAYAAGIADQGLTAEDRSVERAVERVDADTTTALKSAAREAAHDAAAEPVTSSHEGALGMGVRFGDGPTHTNAVRSDSAFEDAFRIRLALAAERTLATTHASVGSVRATASFQDIDDPRDLTDARENVSVESTADGTATRVTFRDVTTTATRDGRVVAERTRDRTVVVAVPTLGAHDRTERFEERLNRGPVDGPGLGRQLTASLYPMTWARGYAQYAGAPVQNVLANRHVELSTNAGIVRTQRDVFGTADPTARGGVARATAETGIADLLAPTSLDEEAWSETVLDAPTGGVGSTAADGDERDVPIAGEAVDGEHGTAGEHAADDSANPLADAFPEDAPTDADTTVAVGHAADVAATDVDADLDAIARSDHRVDASATASASRIEFGGRVRPSSPGSDWSLVSRSTSSSVTGVSGSGTPTGTPSGTIRPGQDRSFGETTREVTRERSAVSTWERTVHIEVPLASVFGGSTSAGNGSEYSGTVTKSVTERTRTSASTTDRYRVTISASGQYSPRGNAPERATRTFGAGGGSDDLDLADTPAVARSDLEVDSDRQVDRISRTAVRRGDVSRSAVVVGDRSATIDDRMAADVNALRRTVRAIETDLELASSTTGEADPYGTLADVIRDRRSELIDAPQTYDGAADRARVSARAAYLDAVVEELERASSQQRGSTDEALDRIGGALEGPSVGDVIESREAARDTPEYDIGGTGPGGAVSLTPNGSPGYLPRTAVDGAIVEAVDGTTTRPLATRNLNYVTVPYGDVSSGIIDRVLGTEDTVDLATAGRALHMTDDTLAAQASTASTAVDSSPEQGGSPPNSVASKADPDLHADRDELQAEIDRSLRAVDRDIVEALGEQTSLSEHDRRQVVTDAASTYDTTGDRAIAVGDGSYADRVATRAEATGELSDRPAAMLTAQLHVTVRDATGRDAVRIPVRFVDGPTRAARGELRGELEGAVASGGQQAVDAAADRWAPKPVRSVGAGLPVAPVPGYWVATVNGWHVEVRGEYPRFTLEGNVGSPDTPFEYVRTNDTVTVDVNGTAVRLGSTDPIQFETSTVIVVAVPAGPPGVGDVDGIRNETSPGW